VQAFVPDDSLGKLHIFRLGKGQNERRLEFSPPSSGHSDRRDTERHTLTIDVNCSDHLDPIGEGQF